MDRKDFDSAKISFEKVVRYSDDEGKSEASYNLAYIEYLQRNLNKSMELCQSTQQNSSAYPYWQGKAAILMADIFAERGEFINAQAILGAVLDRFKDDKELYPIAKEKKEKLDKMIDAQSRLDKSDAGQPMELIDGNLI
jgi:tetratricopeptide (TPR) repeat protein